LPEPLRLYIAFMNVAGYTAGEAARGRRQVHGSRRFQPRVDIVLRADVLNRVPRPLHFRGGASKSARTLRTDSVGIVDGLTTAADYDVSGSHAAFLSASRGDVVSQIEVERSFPAYYIEHGERYSSHGDPRARSTRGISVAISRDSHGEGEWDGKSIRC
jgi:hypothetical protein